MGDTLTPDQPYILGARGGMVSMGLATPASRAFVVGTTAGILAYAMGYPKGAFDEEGNMRPFKLVSQSPEATQSHFLVVPLAAATAAYLFT